MRYVLATGAGLFMFLIVGLVQGVLIGQMFDGIRNPDVTETAILYIGQLAIPCAAAIWAFFRTAKGLASSAADRPLKNPPLERTAAAVYFTSGRASLVLCGRPLNGHYVMQHEAQPNNVIGDACRNCGRAIGSRGAQRDWENVCPHCGQLAWLAVGDVVACKVVSVKPYGVFVELGEGVEGLIPESELIDQPPSGGIALGDTLQARVKIIQTAERRMALSTWRTAS